MIKYDLRHLTLAIISVAHIIATAYGIQKERTNLPDDLAPTGKIRDLTCAYGTGRTHRHCKTGSVNR